MLRATTPCTFSTSQLPKVVWTWCVLYIFDFEMCFAPQRRALVRHLNFQKRSEPGVFCTFGLVNVLRATTACNFSSLIRPAGSAPTALASLLFDPPEPRIISFYLSVRLFIYLSFYLSISLPINLSINQSINLSTYLSTYLSVHLSIYLSIYPSVYLPVSIYLPVHLSTCLRLPFSQKHLRCVGSRLIYFAAGGEPEAST